jgi:hypothetical protein
MRLWRSKGQSARWKVTRSPLYDVPREVTSSYGSERWVFLESRWGIEDRPPEGALLEESGALDEAGVRELSLDTEREAGLPFLYQLEAEVTDVFGRSPSIQFPCQLHPNQFRKLKFPRHSSHYIHGIGTTNTNGYHAQTTGIHRV